MFAPQLLKLVNRLIEMTEKEMHLLQGMKINEASLVTSEKEPLVNLYQSCVEKIKNDERTRHHLKTWEGFAELKSRVAVLGDLNGDHERSLKRVERAQRRFVQSLQEKALNMVQPVKSYNKRGYVVSGQQHYIKQGGGSLAALDQSL